MRASSSLFSGSTLYGPPRPAGSRPCCQRSIDVELTFAGQGVIHERHARLQRLHAFVEVVDVDFVNLLLVDGWQVFHRLANQIGHTRPSQTAAEFCVLHL